MKQKKRRAAVISVCVALAVVFAMLTFTLLWRDSVLGRYIRLPETDDLGAFFEGRDDLELIAVFDDPGEIEDLIGTAIDRDLYESSLVTLVRSNLHEGNRQLNYLFRDKATGDCATVSFIRFESADSAQFKFDFAVDAPLTKTYYVSPWRVQMPGEPDVTFFLPSFTKRGFETHEQGDGFTRSFWFEGDRGIQLTAGSERHETLRLALLDFCREA